MSDFISTVIATDKPEEIAVFGPRGDGKTTGALAAMVAHAVEHSKQGFPLPTKWLGAADTFESHKRKTHESLVDALWGGCWRLTDGGHIATFVEPNGRELVRMHMFGVEDVAALDRLRAQSHGLWFEEPAPSSVMVQSSGLTESGWVMGITSCRLPSYRNPKVMTLNYPDEDHWTARRFVFDPQPGTTYFRIPPGELASATARAGWEKALANRPDMLRRLLRGEFGAVVLGPQVAVGFTRDTHVRPCRPQPGFPVWLGQDGGHTPTTVIGQRVDGRIRILGALSSDNAGIREHLRQLVLPWLGEHAPWVLDDRSLLHGRYDPSMNTDDYGTVETNPARELMRDLPGQWMPGPVSWDGRKNPMLEVLNDMHAGEPVLQVDPVQAKGLIRALDTGWYYAQQPDGSLRKADTASGSALPKKPNHPHEDFGDAFCYLVAGMAPSKAPKPAGWRAAPATGVDFIPTKKSSSWRPRAAVGVRFRP